MFRRVLLSALLCVMVAALAGAGWAGVTTRVSVATGGAQANAYSNEASVSADGRYVAFTSGASNLVAGDTNGYEDVFVHDRTTGTTARVSVAAGGVQANGGSGYPSISADGRYVAFASEASNLVAGDTNGALDVFVHDRTTGTTTRVSVATDGAQGDSLSMDPSISADGRYVAFQSYAGNLAGGGTDGDWNVFVRDRTASTTALVNVAIGGAKANGYGENPSISADGRYVAFESNASNLVAGDANGAEDVFVRDRTTGMTTRVSVGTGGTEADLDSVIPSISADGRYIAFESYATNLVAGDANGVEDVFVHDRTTGTTTRVSVTTGGTEADSGGLSAAISADGRYVAFFGYYGVMVHDCTTGTTTVVSVASNGALANDWSDYPSISADGRYVAFDSRASNLVAGDTNEAGDVFVRDTLGVNTRPAAPTAVTIAPTAPGPEKLTATATGSTDANGDSLTYKYQWSKKIGTTWSAWGYTGRTLAASNVAIGDIWRVRAQALDGTSGSPWKTGSSVTIVSMAGVIPAPKTYNVPVTTCVFASFRWPVQQATVTGRVQLKLGTTKVIPTVMTWVTAEKKIKLRPKSPLLPNTYYRINIDPGITCTSGRVLGWGENYWFKTAPATTTAAVTVAAAPTAGGAELTVNLTSAATVRTVITNIAGRAVAELPERDLPAGVSSLLWNGKSNTGSKVPAGTYLVRVEATGSGGTQTAAVAPLQIR